MIPGRVLGIDPGDVRTGIAISDDLRMMAHPLETAPQQGSALISRIAALVESREVREIVIGLPRNMDGSYGPAAEKARALADALAGAVANVPVHLWDERLTTVAATRSLQESGRSARQQKSVIDQVAAQIILQSWLDSRADSVY
jgi:putative holliday junction resolvase